MEQWNAILNHIPPAMLVIFRIGGLMIFGPVFGSQIVPVRVRVGLAFVTGLAVYPLLADRDGLAGSLALDLWVLGPLVALEVTIGVIIGYIASIPLIAAQTGGLIMGQQVGLGFAQFFNPAVDDEADVVGQLLFLMSLAGFLIIGGHEAMMLAMLHSFDHIPIGGLAVDVALLDLLAGLLLAAFEIALRIAAPLLALIFLETVAMGFLAKTVPQLNILSFGFPLRILLGFFIIAVGLVAIDVVILEGMGDAFDALIDWIETSGGNT